MEPLLIIAIILVVLGIVGSVLPTVPGPFLSFIGLVLLFIERQNSVSVLSLIVFGIGMLVLVLMDYIAPLMGAKFSGATKRGVKAGLLGMLVGLIFFPPLGIFIGAFLGAVIGEAMGGKSPEDSLKAGVGTLLGNVANIVLQTLYSIVLAVYFFIKLF